MARYTKTGTPNTIGQINAELDLIVVAINDTYSRVGDTPNQLESTLDANSNHIINLPVPTLAGDPIRKIDVDNGGDALASSLLRTDLEIGNTNAAKTVAKYSSLQFNTKANLVAGLTRSGETVVISTLPVGTVVRTMGYFVASDGGSNWGLVKSGSHVDDGGRIISINATTYIEMNMVGVINIRKWGCSPSVTNNSTQWQKAQTYAESNTGGETRIPAGVFNCASPIAIGFNGGVQGVGYSSRPTWSNTNAFNFAASGIPSGRAPFKDFWVIGNKAIGTKAFNVDTGDSGATLAIKGLTFQNITVDGFEEAWRLTGTWNAEFRKCETINCFHGAIIAGRNVHTVFNTCNFVRGATGSGTGISTGIQQVIAGGVRAEDIQVKNCLLFGFGYALDIANVLVMHAEGCDFDFCVNTCVRIVIVDGGGSIKSSWLYIVDATNTETGIDFIGIGSDLQSKFIVFGNYIEKATNTSPLVGMDGIFVGVNRRGLEIDKNTIVNFHTSANITSPNVKYTNNKDKGMTTSLSISEFANRCYVHGNEFAGPVNRHPNASVIFGTNEGVTTKEVFTVTLVAGNASVTTTWAALGLPNAPANSSFSVSANNITTTNLGWMRGRASATSVTIEVETAPAGNTQLDVTVTAF